MGNKKEKKALCPDEKTNSFIQKLDVTIRNYSNMKKRLSAEKNFSDFIMPYYSVVLIVYSLTDKYYERFNGDFCSYMSIIISVVLLAFSITNGHAHYGTRLGRAELVINQVKDIKDKLKHDNITNEIYTQLHEEYNLVMRGAEYRDDKDFLLTTKQLCMEQGLNWKDYKTKFSNDIEVQKKLKNYLCELNHPLWINFLNGFTTFYRGILIVLPFILFIICFFI